MKDLDYLRMEQVEAMIAPFKDTVEVPKPRGGWIRAIREALGMTNIQLAARMRRKAPQTIEDMQDYEVTETIKLKTLREVAKALNCRLVYAFVPIKPLEELRRERARELARTLLARSSHSMRMEQQGVSDVEEQRELERQIQKLLSGNPKKLWD